MDSVEYAGRLASIAGWGRMGEGLTVSSVLRSVVVPVWSQEQCYESRYKQAEIKDTMLCAGFHDGTRDSCKVKILNIRIGLSFLWINYFFSQGDSGGPLQMPGVTGSIELIGIISWGRGCARPNFPGVYTRVVNFVPWINEKIGSEECLCPPRIGKSVY